MNTKKLTTAALLAAIGVASGHILYVPVGASKVFPVQHTINLLAGVFLGPGYAVAVAFIISLMRNILGTGSLLAFPGSMIGALLVALIYGRTKSSLLAMAGEIIGTGIIGAIVAYPVAAFIMGREVAAFFFVGPFLLSSAVGAVIGFGIFKLMVKSGIANTIKLGG